MKEMNGQTITVANTQEQIWRFLMEKARTKAQQQHWDGACIAYKQAFELVSKQICQQCNTGCLSSTLCQYIDTAEEFTFAMRKNNYFCAIEALIASIKNNVEAHTSKQDSIRLTAALVTMAKAPQDKLEPLYQQCLQAKIQH